MTAESPTPLTEDEKVALNAGTSLFGWALHSDAFAALVPVVESILLARETALRETIAQAWDQGWTHGVGYSTGQTLNPFSNPYRGQA